MKEKYVVATWFDPRVDTLASLMEAIGDHDAALRRGWIVPTRRTVEFNFRDGRWEVTTSGVVWWRYLLHRAVFHLRGRT